MKFKVDIARGIAYCGKNGYLMQLSKKGIYIVRKSGKEVYLTPSNSKIVEVSYGKSI